jgi:hypothetical protein
MCALYCTLTPLYYIYYYAISYICVLSTVLWLLCTIFTTTLLAIYVCSLQAFSTSHMPPRLFWLSYPYTSIHVPSHCYYYICVLILLYIWRSHTTYVSACYYISSGLILVYIYEARRWSRSRSSTLSHSQLKASCYTSSLRSHTLAT